jgi:hypothetical protein
MLDANLAALQARNVIRGSEELRNLLAEMYQSSFEVGL